MRRHPAILTLAAVLALPAGVSVAAAAGAAPPAAPIFYCPASMASAKPPACPAPPSARAGGGRHGARHGWRRVHVLRHVRRGGRSFEVGRTYYSEDDGTSDSQAQSYRYQLAREGLYPWEVRGHYYDVRHGRYEDRDQDSDDHSSADRDERRRGDRGERRRGGDEGGYHVRGYTGDAERYESAPDEGYAQESDSGYDRSGATYSRSVRAARQEGWSGDEGRWEAEHQADRDSGGDSDRGDADRGDRDAGGWSDGDRGEAGEAARSDDGGRGHAESDHYLLRERQRHGGHVEGETNGRAYGWSWDEEGGYDRNRRDEGRGDDARGGWSEGWSDGDDWQGGWSDSPRSSGRYIIGGVGGRRGVWYDTDDQAQPYAGRDGRGYLVWPGKTPR